MRLTLALILFLISFTLAIPAGAQTFSGDPDSTRYIPRGSCSPCSYGDTFDLPEPPDSLMIDFGFEARSVTIVHTGTDLVIEPITIPALSMQLSDPGAIFFGPAFIYPSTRFWDGSSGTKFFWDVDTLAVADSTTAEVICCWGIRGLKVKGLTSGGDFKAYATTEE